MDGDRYDEIMTLAYGTGEPQWVATTLPEQRQQMSAYIDWEQNADRIVEVAPLLVPGLLQTSDYIRAIMTAGGVPTGEIASRITSRIGRREVIMKPAPADLVVLLGCGALNQGVGGASVALGQVRHLIEMAARPNVELRIVPDHRGWHPGLEGAFALIESSSTTTAVRRNQADRASIVFVGTRRSVLMLHQDDDVGAYARAVEKIVKVALSCDESFKYLDSLRNRMENAQ
ncbi:hypothetical protein BLA60_32585 [Actinophytocola xinjiangensis]|uniref:DUF5753 domain-containing protein n=1 Tax=Actinophytocola xinjiangensis TaxID=485602 RepID=A0A7Z1AUR9_9PSEU|nr:hypothetical protein BLA60_32585 [Actinophytocola xinjiangensis]